MRAVTCTQGRLEVGELPDRTPGRGQVLLEVLRCGICGSDLHARHHGDELAEVMGELGYRDFMRSEQSVVLGHEFCGVVAEYGPGCRASLPTGAHVVALPVLRRDGLVHTTGLSAAAPGGYAEQVVVEESLMLPVPNGLAPELSVLTEPMAVGWHAVRRSEISKRDVAVVIGCGPIGLAVICALKARGVRTVVASELSPARRRLAAACGADVVLDPAAGSPFARVPGRQLTTAPEVLELAVSTTERLRRLGGAWHHVWRAAETVGLAPKGSVVFECVGVPGVIEQIVSTAPFFSRVVVVGVCMGQDRLRPSMAINKEIDLRFVVAYTPLEFRDTLHLLAEGRLDPTPLLTGTTGLAGVEAAFATLASPEVHAKILIDPRSPAQDVVAR